MPATGAASFPDLHCDSHVHTRFCGHATGEMEEYVQAAIAQGLKKLIFLEHMEDGIVSSSKTWLSEEDFDLYFSEGNRLRQRYAGRIEIGLGVECGFNGDRVEEILARLRRRDWDQVGISCHFLSLPDIAEHLNMFSRKAGNVELARRFEQGMLLDRYLGALQEAVRLLPGTMVCHLDGALRHLPGITYTPVHLRMIKELLVTMRAKGMALEVNTSGIPIRGEPFPARPIIAMARDCGIPLILGSDAHKPAEVGRHFGEVGRFILSESCP